MDKATFRLLFRLSIAIAVLLFIAVSTLAGVDVGFGDRRRSVIGVLGAIVAIALISARAAKTRQPGSPPPAWAPDVLLSKALGRLGLTRSSLPRPAEAVRRARRRERVRQVERAALEAAKEDDRLAPEAVRTSAEALFRLVQVAWNERDPARLATLGSPEVVAGWQLSLQAGERASRSVEVLDVQVDYVGLTRGMDDAEDRVIVLIEADLEDAPRVCQYWTLGLRDGLWVVLGTEERAEGDRHLADPIVALAPQR